MCQGATVTLFPETASTYLSSLNRNNTTLVIFPNKYLKATNTCNLKLVLLFVNRIFHYVQVLIRLDNNCRFILPKAVRYPQMSIVH